MRRCKSILFMQVLSAGVLCSSLQIRYNSRLPVVVYAPDGYEIRYRIWKASEAIEKAEKG